MPTDIHDIHGNLLHTHDGDTFAAANLAHKSLRFANFQRATLRGTDNPEIPGRSAGAVFNFSDLSGADFRGADLTQASFHRANLIGAKFDGARLNYFDHDLVSEILRQNAGDDLDKLHISGLILLQRDWCWHQFRSLNHPAEAWAIATIRGMRRADDWRENVTLAPSCNVLANGHAGLTGLLRWG